MPDTGVFEPATPDVERVRARLADLAVLNPRLRVVLNGAELPSHGGLEGYARHLAGADTSVGGREVVDGVEVEFAVAHGASHAVTQGWANQLPCVGSHVAGLCDALGRDEPGRVALVAVTLDHLAYAGRTRERLEVEGVRTIVRDVVRRAAR